MPPSHSLENPFEIPKERDSNHKAFVKSVLSKGAQPKIPKEDFVTEANDDIHLSAEDQKKIEDEQIFSEIIARESRALRQFFGKEILIPPLPKQATKECILEWQNLGLELHYLPHISVAEIRRDPDGKILEVTPIEFPGWKKKPGKQYTPEREGIEFFGDIKSGALDPSAVDLPGGWILVDTCEKPNFGYEYENDPLGRALEELRKEELVEDFVVKESRFNLSPEELKNPKVLETFAKALNPYTIPGFTITIPRAIEFNILGNIYYPQWGDTDTSEWFSDTYRNGERLFGGNSEGNGISLVSWFFSTTRLGGIGFRVIGRFS